MTKHRLCYRAVAAAFALLLLTRGRAGADSAPATPTPVDLFSAAHPKASAGSMGSGAEPSHVIYPDQQLPLRFSHAAHLRRNIDCVTCHTQAASSTSARDNLIPKEAACQSCHPIDHTDPWKKTDGPPAACAACHPGAPRSPTAELPSAGPQLEASIARVQLPEPYLKFNHQLHSERQIGCGRCHGDLSQVDLAGRAQLPKMAQCLSCHNDGLLSARQGRGRTGKAASSRCPACHLLSPDGTLQVQYPSGMLIPSGALRGDDHGLKFRQQHRAQALNDEEYCASCHRRDFCQRCHNGVVKPLDYHGGDYVTRHGMEARRSQLECAGCHRQQTFCLGCHERLGVSDHVTLPGRPPISAFAPATSRRFHPEGWASPTIGPAHHALEAQRNIRTCTSCHREETCLQCHSALSGSALGQSVNPHPADWTTSGRCQALRSRNARVCLKCHHDGSPELRCGG